MEKVTVLQIHKLFEYTKFQFSKRILTFSVRVNNRFRAFEIVLHCFLCVLLVFIFRFKNRSFGWKEICMQCSEF